MCTVSFVYQNGKAIITSNRDEKVVRPSAIPPKCYQVNHQNIYFPKDQKAGGTWYAVNENGTVVVLLNGAIEKHTPKETYAKSRGLIVLEVISAKSSIDYWKDINLENIEPFTLVLFQENKLYQLRWNETEKFTLELDIKQQHVWSSATLYSKCVVKYRANLFYEYIVKNPNFSPDLLFNFHRYTEESNQENGLVINRNNSMKTLSITQTYIEKNKIEMNYFDLQENTQHNQIITIK